MRAVSQQKWGGPETLELVEVEQPRAAPTEILVKVAFAGVNPVDYYTREGVAYNRVLQLPFRHGWDVTGVVEDIGYGVTRFQPGDRVFGMPWFPRQADTPNTSRHPPGISPSCRLKMRFADAAALPLAGLTAWQMLMDVAKVAPGQRVLVSGAAGGVGHLAVQIPKSYGAYVIGTARTVKHDFLRRLGVDETIDYSTTDVADVVRVDIVIQMFGGEPDLKALECLRPGGILVSGQGAWTPGLHKRAPELSVRAVSYLVEPDAAGLEALAELIQKGRLQVHIDHELPLAQASEAHRLISTGQTTGKIVLKVANAAA